MTDWETEVWDQVRTDKMQVAETKCLPDFQIYNFKIPLTKTEKLLDKVDELFSQLIISLIQEQQEHKNILIEKEFQVIILLEMKIHKHQMV